jgi:hypothetical protein
LRTEGTVGNGDGQRITVYKEKERRYKIETNRRIERERREEKITHKKENTVRTREKEKKIGRRVNIQTDRRTDGYTYR